MWSFNPYLHAISKKCNRNISAHNRREVLARIRDASKIGMKEFVDHIQNSRFFTFGNATYVFIILIYIF